MDSRSRRTLLALAALALALRLPGPLDRGLWFDEILTLVDFGRLRFGELLTTFGTDNNHPLFTIFAWLSLHGLGESALALRLPAILFGVVSVGALYLYALRVTDRREALIASLLLATSYHHVWFSQNARGYTLLLTLTIGATALFEELLAGERRRRFPYAVVLGLATYAHLGAVFVAAAHLLVFLVTFRRRARAAAAPGAAWLPLQGLLLAGAVSLLLYAPMLSGMWKFFRGPGGGSPLARGEWYSPWWSVAAAAKSLGLGLVPGLAAMALGLAVVAWAAFDYRREEGSRVLLWLLPGALIAVTLLALGRVLWPRFFFQQAGFGLLLLVRGATLVARRLAGFAPAARRAVAERRLFVAGIAALGLVWLALLPRAWALPKQDYEGALRWLEAHRRPGEVVLTTGLTSIPYQRYYRTDFQPVETVAALDEKLAGTRGAYVLSTLPSFLHVTAPELARALEKRGRELRRFRGGVGEGDVVVFYLEAAPAQR